MPCLFKPLFYVLVVCGFAMHIGITAAETIFVPEQFSTIQQAIDAAVDGDIVEIGAGTFSGHGNRDLRFNGKAITVRGRFGPDFTVIDAEGTPQKPYRGFIFDSGETKESVLEGISICGGATLPGAILDQFNGGGLFFLNSSATVKNCNITDNQCGCWGAGIYCGANSSPVFINCDVSHNSADDDGGAVFLIGSNEVTFVNCNLNGNFSTSTGSAIANFGGGGQLAVINCNFVNNSSQFGNAILGFNTYIANSIIWNNAGSSNLQINVAVVQHSIVEGGHDGIGNIVADPRFVDLTNFNLELRRNSPAIDAGDNTAIPDDIGVDATGARRFRDDPKVADTGILGEQTGISDIGPFEYDSSRRVSPLFESRN